MLRKARVFEGLSASGRMASAGALVVAAVTLSGCSADLSRFDFSSVGPDTQGRTSTASIPIPSEPVRRNVGALGDAPMAPPGPATDRRLPEPYGGPSRTEPEPAVRMSALPEPAPRAPAVRPAPPPRAALAPASPAAPVTPKATFDRAPAAASPPQGTVTIDVQPGDTLYGLSKKHRVSISELMSLNNLQTPAIKPGQKLLLPAGRRAIARTASPSATPPAAASPPPAATRQETSPAARASAPSSPPSGWTGSHTVAARESLYGIARKHGVKVAELQAANGITDPTKIRPGTVLKVPDGRAEVGPAASAATPAPAPAVRAEAPAAPPAATSPVSQPTIINAKEAQTETRVAALPTGGQTVQTDAVAAPEAEPASVAPEAPKASAATRFRWPVKGKVIAAFGPRPDNTHNDGINISVPKGTDVLAAENGVVAYAGNELKGYGNLILIRHDGNWVSAYAHNDSLVVKRGDKVKRGQVIAKAGNTGSVDQPQVHFELRQGAKPVDPLPHMEKN